MSQLQQQQATVAPRDRKASTHTPAEAVQSNAAAQEQLEDVAVVPTALDLAGQNAAAQPPAAPPAGGDGSEDRLASILQAAAALQASGDPTVPDGDAKAPATAADHAAAGMQALLNPAPAAADQSIEEQLVHATVAQQNALAVFGNPAQEAAAPAAVDAGDEQAALTQAAGEEPDVLTIHPPPAQQQEATAQQQEAPAQEEDQAVVNIHLPPAQQQAAVAPAAQQEAAPFVPGRRFAGPEAGLGRSGSGDSVGMTIVEGVRDFAGKTAEISDLAQGGGALGLGGLVDQHNQGTGKTLGNGDWEGVFHQNASEHNVIEGGMGMFADISTLASDDASRTEKAKAGLGATGYGLKAANGILNLTAEHAGLSKADNEGLAAHAVAIGQVSDGFLSGAQGLGAVMDVHDAYKAATADELSTTEKVLTTGQKLASATQNGATAVASAAKVAGVAADGSFKAAGTVANATGVAAIAGVVTGTLEMCAGLYKMGDSAMKQSKLEKVQGALHSTLRTVTSARRTTLARTEALIQDPQAATELQQAQADLTTLSGWEEQLTEATGVVAAMAGIKTSATSDGLKMAIGGGLAAAAGVAALTGAGLPIVLSIGVAAGLIKLGFVAAQWRRNAKASKWIDLAKWLNPDGTKRGQRPEDEDIGFADMESRFLKAYYADPFNRKKKAPEELNHAIRQFGRAEKRKRIGDPQQTDTEATKLFGKTIREGKTKNVKFADECSASEARLYWLQDRATGEMEKHTGEHFYGDFFKWDVAQSAQAKEVKKSEVVDALNHIAWNTFNEAGPAFDTSKGVAQLDRSADVAGIANDDLAQLQQMSDDVILSTTGLKGKASKYLAEKNRIAGKNNGAVAQGDMREYVAKYVK